MPNQSFHRDIVLVFIGRERIYMPPPGDNVLQIGIKEIKAALWKSSFRDLFPELKDPINVYLNNPNCACNQPLYNTLLREKDRLEKYFNSKIELLVTPPTRKEIVGRIFVINSTIDSLESELRKLPIGPKSISIARYESQITAVVQLLV